MVTMRFEGGVELAATLNRLSARLSKRVLVDALERAGEPIRARMGQLAPVEPGPPDLAQNMILVPRVIDGVQSVVIGPSKRFFYGGFQELGTSYHAAQPYARPAFDEGTPAAIEGLRQAIWTSLAGEGIFRPTVSAPSPVVESVR